MKRLLMFVILLLLTVPQSGAQTPLTIGLAWDSVAHPDLVHYEVAWGTASGDYSAGSKLVLQPHTTAQITLPECRLYFINVRACEGLTGHCGPWDGEISGFPLSGGAHCLAPPPIQNLRRNDGVGT